ncbi:MAG: SpvB/TcaC N-terminal domain-containing protein, partial [Flavitalea sp.]
MAISQHQKQEISKSSFQERESANPSFEKNTQKTNSIQVEIPSLSLPKGGGSVKGIDEKFQVNAANGTASLNVPFPLSQSRNSFMPSLELNYNSGSGNGIFGIGWNIDIPAIIRKTEKELPQYRDDIDSDTFIYSGLEDLVPKLNAALERERIAIGTSLSYSYRPRIEGGFSRIQRIVEQDGNCYWKITTKD